MRRVRAASPASPPPIPNTVTRADVNAGLRAAAATVLPIMAGQLAGRPELAAMALGGWLGSLADSGGAYRTRARSIAIFLVGGSLAAASATFVGGRPALAVPLVLLVAAGGAMARVYGDAGATLGTLISVTFCASLSAPAHDLRTAVVRGEWLAAGTLLAALLALLVWPVRPFGPARQSAAAAFRALAAHTDALRAAHSSPTPDEAWLAVARRGHARIRVALEALRATLAETRARRLGSSERGDQLALLLGATDQLFALLVAIEADVAAARTSFGPVAAPALAGLESTLLATARALEDFGAGDAAVRDRHATAVALDRAVVELWNDVERAEATTLAVGDERPAGHGVGALAHLSRAAALIEEAATVAQAAAETTEQVRLGRPALAPPRDRPEAELRVRPAAWWTPLRDNLDRDSVVLRHAMRVGVTAAFALWLVEALGLGHGAWIVYTTIILLQPYAGLTLQRGLHRAAGTIAGGAVAALISATVHEPILIVALMFPLSVAAVAVRTVNYGAFTFFLTPVFVLIAESAGGDWTLAGVRILNTLIGAALALTASRLLWPSWEHRRLSASLGEMVDATHRFFRAAGAAAFREPSPDDGALGELRRHMGLAANNAEAAVERLAGEPRGRWRDVDALVALMAHARRLNGAIVALAQGGGLAGAGELATTAERIDATLREVAAALREERAPAEGTAVALPARTGEFAVTGGATALDGALAAAPLRAVARRADQLRAAAARVWSDA